MIDVTTVTFTDDEALAIAALAVDLLADDDLEPVEESALIALWGQVHRHPAGTAAVR